MQVPDKFINGTIYTMDKENRIVQALLRGDTITPLEVMKKFSSLKVLTLRL